MSHLNMEKKIMSDELALIIFIMNVSMFLLVQYLQEKKMKFTKFKIIYETEKGSTLTYTNDDGGWSMRCLPHIYFPCDDEIELLNKNAKYEDLIKSTNPFAIFVDKEK